MKSGDWQKQFDACNIIKRVILNHKSLISSANPMQLPVFKELIKLADSLRSQLAKNSILTIKLAIENLPVKDLDHLID